MSTIKAKPAMRFPGASACLARFSALAIASAVAVISAGCATSGAASAGAAESQTASNSRTTTTTTVLRDGSGNTPPPNTQRDEFAWGGSDLPVGPSGADGSPAANPAAPSAPPPAPPAAVLTPVPVPSDGVLVQGVASRYQVQAALEDSRPAWASCAPPREGEPATGTVTVAFKLGQDGTVKRVEVRQSSYADARVAECVSRVVKSLHVPDARGGETNVIYPFHFGPTG